MSGLDRKLLGQHRVEGRYHSEVADHVIDRASECVLAYTQLIDPIRKVARQFGYAIGVHGSLARDIDLIAAPWSDEAVDHVLLVDAIAALVKAQQGDSFGTIDADCQREKPHGRRCWSIHGFGYYIDLSVMPRTPTPVEPEEERA